MRELIDKKSALEQSPTSRLPTFEPEWVSRIKGTVDFLGLNYYTANLVTSAPPSEVKSWGTDSETKRWLNPDWPKSATFWLRVVPWGLRKLLNWIKNEYNNPEMLITENGVSDKGEMDDTCRIDYLQAHINQVLKAIKLDNCNVTGYMAWSLMDNFEWNSGYK